jgi:FAD/FMN-containing dehydrogenase
VSPSTLGRSASELVAALRDVVGPAHVLTERDVVASYETDWTGRFHGPALAVVRPADTAEVAAVVVACAAAGVPVVVQGGNTGLVGGSVPPSAGGPGPVPVVLSTRRLDHVGPVDPVAQQVTVGAGATLAQVAEALAPSGLRLAVDLAARQSATIGGMVACNAGGLHVVRYGAMRQQVVGVEAVLADGRVLSRMSGLVKDNTGYDLSQLLVGSEGTLAVVTAVRLRLVPEQPERAVALMGVGGVDEAVALAARLRRAVDGLVAAELVTADGMALVCRHRRLEPPLARAFPAYLLVEVEGRTSVVEALAEALEAAGVADDATAVALDDAGATRLWEYREAHTEAVASLGVAHKLDVTLPLDRLGVFAGEVQRVIAEVDPTATVVLFGHVGDGNLHVNVVGPAPDDDGVDDAVLRLVADHGGSISAEHGIGRAKVPWLGLSRTASELAAMRAIKRALDPAGLFNPGVLLPMEDETPGPSVPTGETGR